MNQTEPGKSADLILPIRVKPWMVVVGVAVFLAAMVEIQFSVPSWQFFYGLLRGPLKFLDSTITTANEFVAELTIIVIIIVTWIHQPRLRHTIAPYLLALLISSTIVNVTKVIVGRARPHHGAQMDDTERREVEEYLKTHDNPVLKPERGDYWLFFSKDRPGVEFLSWFTGDRKMMDRRKTMTTGDYSSFPSGHATSAFLLALYLSIIYPRARRLWYVLAVCTALFRIRDQMHYPGDVIAGASIGWLTGLAIFSREWAARFGFSVQRKLEKILGSNKS